jgi:hypothetical protein
MADQGSCFLRFYKQNVDTPPDVDLIEVKNYYNARI